MSKASSALYLQRHSTIIHHLWLCCWDGEGISLSVFLCRLPTVPSSSSSLSSYISLSCDIASAVCLSASASTHPASSEMLPGPESQVHSHPLTPLCSHQSWVRFLFPPSTWQWCPSASLSPLWCWHPTGAEWTGSEKHRGSAPLLCHPLRVCKCGQTFHGW